MALLGSTIACFSDTQISGKTNGSFHLKGLVVTDLDQFLDTQVIVGAKMRGNIKKMSSKYFNYRKCLTEDSDDALSNSDDDVVLT